MTFDRTADGQIITLPHRIESRIQYVHLVVSLVFGQSVSGFGSALDLAKPLLWLVQKKLNTFCFLTFSVGFKVKPQIMKTSRPARLEVVLSWAMSEFRI